MSETSVLNKEAYLLFYQKRTSSAIKTPPASQLSEPKSDLQLVLPKQVISEDRADNLAIANQEKNSNSSATTQGSTLETQSKQKEEVEKGKPETADFEAHKILSSSIASPSPSSIQSEESCGASAAVEAKSQKK